MKGQVGKPPLLEVRGLCHDYGRRRHARRALDQADFTLERGEIVGIVGESGSGKSTLARTLLGLLDKTAGEVLLDGERLPSRYRPRDFRRYRGRMQMVFQDPWATLNPRLTVGASLAEPLQLSGRGREAAARTAHWLQRVGLSPAMAGRYPHEFSGGQRQRIGIARALLFEPELLVCDEPVSALDVSVQAQVVNLLAALRRELGLALLFIAHDLALVRYLCDRVLVMHRGRLVETGPVEQVLAQPAHPYTRLLLDSRPIADPSRRRLLAVQSPPPSAGTAPGCALAPRCQRAGPSCLRQTPPLQTVGQRQYACFHPLAGGSPVQFASSSEGYR